MMNFRKTFLLTMGLSLAAQAGYSQESLPYIGPQAKACAVNSPQAPFDEIDAGYLTSEDCSVLFVKPPLEGSIEFMDPVVYDSIASCSVEKRARQQIANHRKEATSTSNSYDAIMTIQLLQLLEEQLQGLYNVTGTVANLAATIKLNRQKILTAYKQANPHIRDIRNLPVDFGALSARVVDNSTADPESDQGNVIRSLHISGSPVTASNKDFLSSFLPENLHKLFVGAYPMGQASTMEATLNLKGACALFDANKIPLKSPDVFFVPTYNYVYKVQTKSFFRVEIDTTQFQAGLESVAMQLGLSPLKIEDVRGAIKGKGAINITLNDGFSDGGLASDLETKYKDEITNAVIETFLVTAASKINNAKTAASYTAQERRTRRVCKRRLFWKSCHTRVYFVPVKKIHWPSVKRAIARIGGNESGQAQQYSNIRYMDSVVFDTKDKL